MNYRREVDGLRALAVLPVILFHAGFPAFAGGFIGVDIFFVLSGYLITGILLGDLESGRFSIATFYERRARRILPALFVVLLACLPFAWAWLLPSDMQSFSESLAAVAVFSSNLLFAHDTGYFSTANELKPLLHTWSLAVEEQFYLFFPLLLALTWRLGRRGMMAVIAVLSLASLYAAWHGVRQDPATTFYLLHARAWELAIGALVALHLDGRPRLALPAAGAEALALAGLALVLASMATCDQTTPFPSLYTLPPTLGTALLLLAAGPATRTGRLLGSRALVGVGLISYSAYLWHQPLFAFARHRSLDEPGAALYLALGALSLPLAWLTWRYVEQPFRDRGKISRKAVFAMAIGGSAVLAGIGLFGHYTKGYLLREDLRMRTEAIEERMRHNIGLDPICDDAPPLSPDCQTSDDPEILLWGDSFAMHLASGIVASNPHVRMIQITRSTCGPVLGAAPVNYLHTREWARECLDTNRQVLDYLRRHPRIRYVAMGSLMQQYANEDWQLLLADGKVVDSPGHGPSAFLATLRTLKDMGRVPVVFSPTPQDGRNIGNCLRRTLLFGASPERCTSQLAVDNARQARVVALMKAVEREARVVWLTDGLCRDGACPATQGDILVYRDHGHLSYEGSAWLGKQMDFYRLITTAPATP